MVLLPAGLNMYDNIRSAAAWRYSGLCLHRHEHATGNNHQRHGVRT